MSFRTFVSPIFALIAAFCLATTALAASVAPEISAPSAILMETSTGRVLYERRPTPPFLLPA